MATFTKRPTGMTAFTTVWLGQIVSVLATNMTQFALTIWVFEKTGSATALGLMNVFFITPFLIVSPFAGVMVDRHNRRLMMMLSDLGAGLATVAILVLQAMGALQVWHLYITASITGVFQAFQWPAYSAAISTMVSKEQYGRANGMMSLVEAGPAVASPLLAGALLPIIGLTGVMLVDVITFVFAIGALLVVHVPQPQTTEAGRQGQGGILKESVYGFKYIFARPGLLGLQLVFLVGNLMAGIGFTVLAPMILARTNSDELTFGGVQSAGAIGGVVGGVVMSAWGGPKRRVHGVLIGWAVTGLLSQTLVGLGRGFPIWAVAMFVGGFFIPIINGSNQAIWQAKVAPEVQGRVFASRRLIAWITQPLSPLIAGPLADFVLEPAMRDGGNLTGTFGWLVGTGPGAGMALLMVITGVFATAVGLGAYLFPAVRDAENILPDHDAAVPVAADAAA
ncbi:MAG TPA: MFS transporter [Anaerolineales bacterium]|nr:MFS transporter [Anaerolineales bacterium]